jgi:propionate CoA-transferase
VTERCVFKLEADGVHLVEVAPGIDIERDILSQMDFRPVVGDVAPMDARIYRPRPMGLAAVLLDLELSDRLTYDTERNTLFANFEGMSIRTTEDIESVRRVFDTLCKTIGRKVALIVNYDGFQLDDSLADAYFEMVADLQAKHYTTATRYTTSAFMRMKLGAALPARSAAAHVFETHAEATEFLRRRPHVVKAAA